MLKVSFGTTCALFCSRNVQQPCIFSSVLQKTCRYSMSRVVPSESCQETTVALHQMQLKAILLQVQRLQAQLDLQLPLLHLQLSRSWTFLRPGSLATKKEMVVHDHVSKQTFISITTMQQAQKEAEAAAVTHHVGRDSTESSSTSTTVRHHHLQAARRDLAGGESWD